jgi:hypothetical protein
MKCIRVAIAILTTCAWYCSGEQPVEIPPALSVGFATAKNAILMGEPLMASLWIRNSSSVTQTLYHSACEIGEIFISRDGQTFKHYSSCEVFLAASKYRKLEPGEEYRGDRTVLYSGYRAPFDGRYAFPAPGEYYLRAQYRGNQSEVLSLTVREPTGEESLVWKQLQAIDATGPLDTSSATPFEEWSSRRSFQDRALYARLLQFPHEPLPVDAVGTLCRIVQEHPRSSYTDYISLALAKHLMSVGGPDRSDVIRYLQIAAAPTREAVVREEALLLWAREESGSKRIEIGEQLLREFPNSRYKQRVEDMLKVARSSR